jgi:glycosyltransferase involved in cell wall biosynthesis
MTQKPYDDLISHEGIRISVCMAVRNGANFIEQQIGSILPQLGKNDEFVIVDDASQDNTIDIIEGFRDERIRIVRHERNRGVVQSFGRALEEARGEILFLTDHDDIWRADKVEKFLEMFRAHPDLTVVMSDLVVIDAAGKVTSGPKFGSRKFHRGLFRTLLQNRYQGSTMALRRSILEYCLPFPADIPIHDVWIGLVNRFVGEAGFIPEPLLFYRRHGTNDSPSAHAPLLQMIRWRWALVKNLVWRYLRTTGFRSHRTGASN